MGRLLLASLLVAASVVGTPFVAASPVVAAPLAAVDGSAGQPQFEATPAVSTRALTIIQSAVRLPVAVSRAAALVDGTGIVLAGGLTSRGTVGSIVRVRLGPPQNGAPGPIVAATEGPGHLRYPVHDAAGVLLGGRMLLFGGGRTTAAASVQEVMLGGASSLVGRLPAARADLGAVVLGGAAIVAGGGALGRADPRVLRTSDGVHFTVIARLPIAVRYAAVAAVGERVFVIGGTSASGDVSTIQVVDIATGTARVAGHLPAPVSHATALVLGGRIVVAGGRRSGRALDAVVSVDPTTLVVASAGRLPRPLSDVAGVVADGVGYLLGGEAAGPLSTIIAIR